MSLQKARVSMKSEFAVRQGATPGSAHLVAKSAGRRAAYEWQYSTDQKTWTDAPTTLKAKTDILGLAAGSTYYFRFRAVLNTGDGAWSPVLSLPVV
jgi:predicted phage tail protein